MAWNQMFWKILLKCRPYRAFMVVKWSGRNMWTLHQNIPMKSGIIILNTDIMSVMIWLYKTSLDHHTAPRTQALRASVCILAKTMFFFHSSAGLNNVTKTSLTAPPSRSYLIFSPSHLMLPASLTVRQLFLHNGIFHFNTLQDGLSPIGGKW